MDWQQRTSQWMQQPHAIALLAGAIAMTGLILFQADSFRQKKTPMCELIAACHLRHGDLQRIQVALGESGLSDFEIDGQKLLVPKSRHSEYLKAVSEHNALPMDLRDDQTESFSNPLLSRSQQQALKWQQKKRQLKEMVLRLPFVQQAWLEVDSAASSSPFQPMRHSAVVSIQPDSGTPLSANHVDTIRRMIGGAVAGLEPDQIEVIDLSEGFAYDRAGENPIASAPIPVAQLYLEEQRLEKRIKSALSRYSGIHVKVKLVECAGPASRAVSSGPVAKRKPERLVAGSNGVASIYDDDLVSNGRGTSDELAAAQVAFTRAVSAIGGLGDDSRVCRVHVDVGLPESALENVAMSLLLRRPDESSGKRSIDPVERKFEMVRPQIEREISALLPDEWVQASGSSPIAVSLERSESTQALDQSAQLKELFRKYWPSIATLCVGMLMMSLVVRRSTFQRDTDSAETHAVLSLAQHREKGTDAAKSAKENINQMFRDDPDGAAAAIEGWIRKAG